MKSMPRAALALTAVSLVLSACASDTPAANPGQPADPTEATRVIEITGSDDFRFDPAEITVQAGDIVTFRITNVGNAAHDFTMGDEAMQQEHEEEMLEMGGMSMSDEPNAVTVAPGEVKEITWMFTDAGTVLIGCHQPGHYSAGMRGNITVEG